MVNLKTNSSVNVFSAKIFPKDINKGNEQSRAVVQPNLNKHNSIRQCYFMDNSETQITWHNFGNCLKHTN